MEARIEFEHNGIMYDFDEIKSEDEFFEVLRTVEKVKSGDYKKQ